MDSNKISISLGLIISILGALVLAACTWIGFSLRLVSPLMSSIAGILVAIAGIVVMLLAVRAKTATKDFGKWRIVEICCIAGMMAVITFAFTPTVLSFNFIKGAGGLRQAANTDIGGIESLMEDFKNQEERRLRTSYAGMYNFVRLGNANCAPGLRQFLNDYYHTSPENLSYQLLRAHRGEDSAKIADLRIGNDSYAGSFRRSMEVMRGTIRGANPIPYASLAYRLSNTAEQAGQVMSTVSRQLMLPNVRAGASQQYGCTMTEATVYSYTPTAYRAHIDGMKKFTIGGIVFAMCVSLLYLFYYLITYRSLKKAIDKGNKPSDALGLPL